MAALYLINISRIGKAMVAIHSQDDLCESLGINVFHYKRLAYVTASFFAGIAGSLWAHYYNFIQPLQFQLKDSVWYLGMIIVGGAGSTLGAVLGTVSISLLDSRFAPFISGVLTEHLPLVRMNVTYATGTILFALVIIIFLIKQPRGLAHWWQIIKTSYRLWPYSY